MMSMFNLFGEVDISHALEMVAAGVEAAVAADERRHGRSIHQQACAGRRGVGQLARHAIEDVARESGVDPRWLLGVCPPERGPLRHDLVVGAASVRKV